LLALDRLPFPLLPVDVFFDEALTLFCFVFFERFNFLPEEAVAAEVVAPPPSLSDMTVADSAQCLCDRKDGGDSRGRWQRKAPSR
jgi:hypothetical protein